MKQKRILVLILVICGIVMLGTGIFLQFFTKDKNIDNKEEQTEQKSITKKDVQLIEEQYKKSEMLLNIESYQMVSDNGTVVIGTVINGKIALYDDIYFINSNGKLTTAKITGLEKFKSTEEFGVVGEQISVLLSYINEDEIKLSSILFNDDK